MKEIVWKTRKALQLNYFIQKVFSGGINYGIFNLGNIADRMHSLCKAHQKSKITKKLFFLWNLGFFSSICRAVKNLPIRLGYLFESKGNSSLSILKR